MEIKAIELTVHSCKDLKGFNFFQKMSVYAKVWVGNPKKEKKTPPDRENDRNPEWKHRMRFELDESADKLALDFEIRKEGGLGDKSIGRVHVPVMDLLEDYTGGVRYVRYQMKGSNDEAAGLLNFSYSIEGKDYSSFHGTNPQQDAGKPNSIGSACSEWYQAPSAPPAIPESLFAAPPSVIYPLVDPPQAPYSAPYPSDQSPPTSSFGSYQPETSCMEPHRAPMGPPSAPYLPIPAQAEGHHAPPSLQVWPPHPSEVTAPINPDFSAPPAIPESLFAAPPSVIYPPVDPPQAPYSAPYPSDQSPPTSSFGSYQPETSCMEPHRAPMGPPSAPYLPIPAQAEGHHAPPSLQVWPPHPSEVTAPINPDFSAAQPPLMLPHFRPAFPPPPPPPPALPFPPSPPPPHLYYHHPPPPPPDHQFRAGPFGFAPHDPSYWR